MTRKLLATRLSYIHSPRNLSPDLGIDDVRQRAARLDFTPTDQSPMLVDTSTQRNLLSLFGTRWRGESDCDISTLDSKNRTTGLRSTNVDKQRFTDNELGHLGLFAIVRLDTQQSSQQKDWLLALIQYEKRRLTFGLDLDVDVGSLSN